MLSVCPTGSYDVHWPPGGRHSIQELLPNGQCPFIGEAQLSRMMVARCRAHGWRAQLWWCEPLPWTLPMCAPPPSRPGPGSELALGLTRYEPVAVSWSWVHQYCSRTGVWRSQWSSSEPTERRQQVQQGWDEQEQCSSQSGLGLLPSHMHFTHYCIPWGMLDCWFQPDPCRKGRGTLSVYESMHWASSILCLQRIAIYI